jgi:hypothetical protein
VTTNRRADEHEIPNISKLLVLDLEIGEGASDFPLPLTRTFETVVLLAGEARPDPNVRIGVREPSLEVATVEGVVHPAYKLHVLLRHRPPSIPC